MSGSGLMQQLSNKVKYDLGEFNLEVIQCVVVSLSLHGVTRGRVHVWVK